MHGNARRRYALSAFSVEYRPGKGWFYGLDYQKQHEFKGPYSSIASVTLMIARKLRKETERRDKPYALE